MQTEQSQLVGEASVNLLRLHGYGVVTATDPYGRFLDRNRCLSFKSSHVSSRG
jgi:hypothetical protein